MKLIDADTLYDCVSNSFHGTDLVALKDILGMIEKSPTVNAAVLPCKVGDTLYMPGFFGPYIYTVAWISWKCELKHGYNYYQIHLKGSGCDEEYINFSDIGKTVFLTEEEADKAFYRS